jgi:hypothetical protein
MKRLIFVILPFFLAGCQQTRPPSAEGLKKSPRERQREPSSPNSKRAPHPEAPRAWRSFFWDLKVFNIKDKEDGLRQEWKTFEPAQTETKRAAVARRVMMNAGSFRATDGVFAARLV